MKCEKKMSEEYRRQWRPHEFEEEYEPSGGLSNGTQAKGSIRWD